jgi:hypothetical protein
VRPELEREPTLEVRPELERDRGEYDRGAVADEPREPLGTYRTEGELRPLELERGAGRWRTTGGEPEPPDRDPEDRGATVARDPLVDDLGAVLRSVRARGAVLPLRVGESENVPPGSPRARDPD